MKQKEPKRRMQRGEFRILEFKNPSGQRVFRVYGWKVDGNGFEARVRENYKTQSEAIARRQQLEVESANLETAAQPVFCRLTPEQAIDAETAIKELAGKATLCVVARYWLDNYRKPVTDVRLADALTQFLAWLDSNDCQLRAHSKKNLRNRVSAFVNSMPGTRVADVTPDTIDTYLSKRAVSPKSKDNDRRAISRFFAWCMDGEGSQNKRRWTAANPCRKEKGQRQTAEQRPTILNVEQCKALLQAAASHKSGVVAPYVAVSLFGGLRPFEAQRLTWQAVNLADNEIRLEGTMTKTGRPRVVAVGETLRAWLKAYDGKPFLPENWRRELDVVKEAAGLVTRETAKSKGTVQKRKKGKLVNARHYWKRIIPIAWAPDILRHTAASHYFRQTGSYGKTAEQFGNSEAIIKRHYQGLVSSEDTKAFYALLPTVPKAARSRKIITLATQTRKAAEAQTVAARA
jgi:integrase